MEDLGKIKFYLEKAIRLASSFRGATSPNPPVGAVGLDSDGMELAIACHEKAGEAHAEVKVIEQCQSRGLASRLHTLIVTLEPCNHLGKTPPCTDILLKSAIKKVIIGSRDPNPKVQGGGLEKLKAGGIDVREGVLQVECDKLIAPFKKWITQGIPWVTLKTAHNLDGNMIPPQGSKTFTSQSSLLLSHELRKRADAIVTGSETVLKDFPEFTVRNVPDHPDKKRYLCVLDRRKRVPEEWFEKKTLQGFEVMRGHDFLDALQFLGSQGCLEVLIEAGPTLTQFILDQGYWDEHYRIQVQKGLEDQVENFLKIV